MSPICQTGVRLVPGSALASGEALGDTVSSRHSNHATVAITGIPHPILTVTPHAS